MIRTAIAYMLLPTALTAGELAVENAMIPLAPPGVMAHAAYFKLSNNSDASRQLIGVSAEGYMMAHIHKTEVKDDIATMTSIDVLEIAPGQSVAFEPGGLHIMLMRPAAKLEEGANVNLTLEFADGETLPFSAEVMPMMGGTHGHDS